MNYSIQQKIKTNVDLAAYTTFHLGGPAEYFVEIVNLKELAAVVAWAREKKLPLYILGGGSNLLISDDGVKGLVVKLNNIGLKARGRTIIAEAGAALASAVELAKSKNLSGLEWAVGIPGTVGGAVRGNAGAYGSSIADLITKVKIFNITTGQTAILTKDDCDFSYRNSIFKQQSELVVWQATLRLNRSLPEKIETLMDNNIRSRLQTIPKFPSAGCIFKNLEVSRWPDNAVVRKAVEQGKVLGGKLGCGYLIELLDLKGKQLGGARVAPEHGNHIINYQHAKAADVKALIEEIRILVKQKFDLDLETEVQLLGF